MARPQVADGGDGFHIWRVAESILNSCGQLRRGVSLAWGLVGELRTLNLSKPTYYEMLHRTLE
jgi:hypothetical protein